MQSLRVIRRSLPLSRVLLSNNQQFTLKNAPRFQFVEQSRGLKNFRYTDEQLAGTSISSLKKHPGLILVVACVAGSCFLAAFYVFRLAYYQPDVDWLHRGHRPEHHPNGMQPWEKFPRGKSGDHRLLKLGIQTYSTEDAFPTIED